MESDDNRTRRWTVVCKRDSEGRSDTPRRVRWGVRRRRRFMNDWVPGLQGSQETDGLAHERQNDSCGGSSKTVHCEDRPTKQ